MSAARFELSRLADYDLNEIWRYTHQHFGQRQASRYLRQLARRFEALAKKPGLGKQRDDLAAGLRCFHEGRHLIVYTRLDEQRIAIVRVLHDRMDVAARLNEDH